MDNSISEAKQGTWLDRPLLKGFPQIKLEHLLITLILLLTLVSRFYILGERVMSHDEVNHVVPSYDLYLGKGYSHDPVTHGPMQFHLVALSYFLFGDSDFTSRVPAALFSIATVAFVLFAWRRYLGRTGALLSGLFYLISPYLLFYGRYTRNEAFIGLFGVILLYAVLNYLEKGKEKTLYLYTVVLSLYFCTKETSFIFTAEMLIFLAFVFLRDINQLEWKKQGNRDLFILLILITFLLLGIALGSGVIIAKTSSEAAAAATGLASVFTPSLMNIILYVSIGLAAAVLIFALFILLSGLGWQKIRTIRSFDLLLLTFTLVMPQLIAFPIKLLGWNPLDYTQTGLIRTSIVLAVVVALAVAIGLIWKPKLWLKNAAVFYTIFTILYTTFFTNGQGFFTGLVGSLGYWLSQQGVNRGTQPLYYYALVQIPMYEYLSALGTILAVILGIRHKLFSSIPNLSPARQVELEQEEKKKAEELESTRESGIFKEINEITDKPGLLESAPVNENEKPSKVPVLALLVYWSVMTLLALSVAGEKMPWLTLHIALPMLLAAGWSIGYLVDTLTVKKWNTKALLSLLLFPILLISLSNAIGMWIGADKPFAGMELAQLQLTSTFIFSVIAAGLSGWGIYKLTKGFEIPAVFKTLVVTVFAILAVLTARSAFQASYVNYDNGKEFLVYAHGANGPKDIYNQVLDISQRTTGGKDVKVAYIGDALYPYWWYFRDFPNKTWIKDQLTHELTQYPLVISDDTELTKTRAILKDDYYEFKYKRLVWPMQDYMNQTLKSVWVALKDSQMRQAVWNIWLNKDYTLYASLKGITTLTVENWEPSGNIYLFIKKDLVSSIWTYGTVPQVTTAAETDPYAANSISLTPDLFFGSIGSSEGQLDGAHDIAIGQNGDIYVTDSKNNRIERFSSTGQFISAWGSFAEVDKGDAPGGTFNEPWGIAIGPDGSVYVTDTWNYRVQKFTAEGKFVTMWGSAGLADSESAFWGPRGIVVNASGHVFVTDTGNNRVVVYDSNGNYISQFGVNGIEDGEFDEPVGLAVDDKGQIYVADTWNQRIQVFAPAADGVTYQYVRQWSVSAWDGQSINNKPFIDLDQNGNVYVTDTDAYRVLEFDNEGNFIRGWGDYSSGIDGFGMPIGIAVDAEGKVWVSDAENGYLLRFTMPADEGAAIQADLPAIPAAAYVLTYNATTGLVEDPDQNAVYRLSADGAEWVPVVPEDVAALLPEDVEPTKNDSGAWVLLQSDGTVAFRWQAEVLLWAAETEIEPVATGT